MAAAKAKWTDLFMQFFTLTVTTGANASALSVAEHNTNLALRGMFGWLVHMIEFRIFPLPAGVASFIMGVSTARNVAAMFTLQDPGVLALWSSGVTGTLAAGLATMGMTHRETFQPAIPIAAPNLSFAWGGATADDAAWRSVELEARIGYTTFALDPATYTEIAEVWS